MKIMFGEEGNYDSEAEVATERRSQDSLQNSIDSRNSGESVEQLEERLRQLESIIRSKDRIDAEQIRDSLKDEVLIGQGGGRVGKAY
jgi:transcription elongation GreA/GreB family factor